eukprot:scaffold241776_cov39-Tisochrysis_lutea.AAC.1
MRYEQQSPYMSSFRRVKMHTSTACLSHQGVQLTMWAHPLPIGGGRPRAAPCSQVSVPVKKWMALNAARWMSRRARGERPVHH